MKTNLRERLTRYRCFIRPKVHFSPEFSFNKNKQNKTKQKKLAEAHQAGFDREIYG